MKAFVQLDFGNLPAGVEWHDNPLGRIVYKGKHVALFMGPYTINAQTFYLVDASKETLQTIAQFADRAAKASTALKEFAVLRNWAKNTFGTRPKLPSIAGNSPDMLDEEEEDL